MKAVTFGQLDGFYLFGDGLSGIFRFDAGSRGALHPLASLTVVSWHYRRFPTHVYPLADLLERSTTHERFHDFVLVEITRLELHQKFLVHESVDGRELREDLGIVQVFNRLALLVDTLQIDVVLVDAFVERTDGNASRSGEQGDADIVPTQSQGTGSRLVVFHGQHGYIGIPVGGDEAYFRCTFHDDAGTVRQAMQHGRVRTEELCFDGVFLVHQVVSFQLHVGIGIMRGEVLLDGIHIFLQGIGGGEVDDEFTIRQRRVGDASHKVISSRSTPDGGSDMGDFLTGFQIAFYLLQILRYLL